MAIVLVTGVAGFIGMALAEHLIRRGDTVIGIDNLDDYYDVQLKRDRLAHLNQLTNGRFHFHEIDFADMPTLEKALAGQALDTIAHLGGQAGIRHSIDNPHIFVQSNLVGHVNLLEIARQRHVPMVYASSSSVYGMRDDSPFREDDRVDHPVSLYAATKKADELLSETYAHLFRIPQTGLRFFTVYGPWGRPDMAVWGFTDKIFNGQTVDIYNDGHMYRDFTYIDDIIAGMVASIDTPPLDDGTVKPGGSISPHRIYNIGNNRSVELLHLVDVLEQACGRKAVRRYLPMQPGDVKDTFADVDAIAQDLGYNPATPIEVGIPQFVEWYKAYTGRS